MDITTDIETVPSESSLSKKEIAIKQSGAVRELGYKKLVEMTKAKIMVLDKFGCEHFSDDNSTQLRAAELILKVNNDLKEGVNIDNRVVNVSGVTAEVLTGLLHMVKDVADQLKLLRTSGQQTGEIIDVQTGGV